MIFGGLSTKITKEEQRSCKGVYLVTFDAPEVKKKCQAKGIIAFLRNNILKVANYMSSLRNGLFLQATEQLHINAVSKACISLECPCSIIPSSPVALYSAKFMTDDKHERKIRAIFLVP